MTTAASIGEVAKSTELGIDSRSRLPSLLPHSLGWIQSGTEPQSLDLDNTIALDRKNTSQLDTHSKIMTTVRFNYLFFMSFIPNPSR